MKKYCVKLLEDFGSLSYTRRIIEELVAEVRPEVAKLGGNQLIGDVLDDVMSWKRDTDERKPDE
jgi:geranylgeranyl diphosphate synthase type 3